MPCLESHNIVLFISQAPIYRYYSTAFRKPLKWPMCTPRPIGIGPPTLRKRTLSPVRLVLKATFFCCYLPQWCIFVFWGVSTRLD